MTYTTFNVAYKCFPHRQRAHYGVPLVASWGLERQHPSSTILCSELLQQSLGALPSERGISYYTKHIRGRDYWYGKFHVGATRRQVAIGPDSEALRARIVDHRDRVAADVENAAEC